MSNLCYPFLSSSSNSVSHCLTVFPLHNFGLTRLESSILKFVCSIGMPHLSLMRSLLTLVSRKMNTFPGFISPSWNTFPYFLGGRGFTADQVGKYLYFHMLESEQQITALTTIELWLNVSNCPCTGIPSSVKSSWQKRLLAVTVNHYSNTDLHQQKIYPSSFSSQSIKLEK